MPYKFQYTHQRIPKTLDRRVKVTQEDKEEMRRLFYQEKLGVREIARMYEKQCSRRSVQYAIFPERLLVIKAQHKENRKDGRYYNKEKHTEYMRSHRRYKQSIKNKLVN